MTNKRQWLVLVVAGIFAGFAAGCSILVLTLPIQTARTLWSLAAPTAFAAMALAGIALRNMPDEPDDVERRDRARAALTRIHHNPEDTT